MNGYRPSQPTRRVLHVTSGMNRGGVETWIMNVLRRIDPSVLGFDFLVETDAEADYDQEIRHLGGRILRSPRFRHRARASARLVQVLRRHGPYHAVHAHGRHDAGWPISVARAAGVPVRIGHVHNIKQGHDKNRLQRSYKRLMKRLLLANASWILGCSMAALRSLYGDRVERASKLEMLPYGIDMDAFQRRDSRASVQAEFGLPPQSRILGHVGRFVWEKNHGFLLQVFAELARRDPRWHLLLVGDGRLRAELEAQVQALGVGARVRFAGVRADVPDLMSAMDAFAFPSHMEGFGLVAVEAQALGVPCVLGTHLPAELDAHRASVTRLALSAGPPAWADAVERAARAAGTGDADRAVHSAAAHAAVAASHFNIDRSVATLISRYYGIGPVADGDRSVLP